MVTYKSFNNIVLEILDYLNLAQPSLDVKPNSVARDLFIDPQAFQMSNIYEALKEISSLQSIANTTGQDLTNYGSNYGLTRQTGTSAIGTAVFTFRSLDSDITIPEGSVVRTRNGIPFLTVSTTLILTSQSNALRATATRLREQLYTAEITDEFAIEVSVQAQSPGTAGNISTYSLISHSISGVNSVTNVSSFTGGTDLETDSAFRSRILATFSSANVGTAIGYRSVVLSLSDAIDALVVEPGDPLMVRDGTVTVTDSYGNITVSEPGTGGRVDIYVMGENNQSGTDSFVYYDQSGSGSANNILNDFVLGQSDLTASTSLTLNSRRVATLSGDANIPQQPVSKLVSVSGSSSGPNFVEEYLDSAGNSKGNYQLVKDTGIAGGSSFGLDKLRWISNEIELTDEAHAKGVFNGIDGLSFVDVSKIKEITQDVQITNENSSVDSTRTYVTVNHTPIRTVTRVFNLTTGERYTISDQNPDGSGDVNDTGRIKITGRSLPTVSDVLQVDYTWVFEHDPDIDFDNLNPGDDLNTVQDSIEWGFSNYIRDEYSSAILDSYNNLTVQTQYPISRILYINSYNIETSTVDVNGNVTVTTAVTGVHKITDLSLSGNPEVYNTKLSNGSYSNLVITLPTDTIAETGDTVSVIYNLNDLSAIDGYSNGNFVNNTFTINPSTAVTSGTAVLVNYVANFLNIFPLTEVTQLPVSGDGFNSFVGIDGYQPVQNLFSGSNIEANMRRSPSNLVSTISSIPSEGTIKIIGTTINRAEKITVVATDDTIDLESAIKSAMGISSRTTLSTSIALARVISLQSVTTTAAGEVSTIVNTYDLTNYGLLSNDWDKENAIEDSTLSRTEMSLASTTTNTTNAITTGTKLKVVFYYSYVDDSEDLFYSRNGKIITDKKFGYISSISRISGLQDSGGTISGRLQIDTFNQPESNISYAADYNYTAPKDNERITINYEYNKLIVDATQAIENSRPITADVLAKAATKIELDVSATIIVLPSFTDRESTVQQDVADNITATLSASALETTLDQSDIINNAYNVQGLDRIRITRFNKKNVTGTKLSISAQKSEYLAPGNVIVIVEDR
jgi:uncharacterized phage protein gp47/JayE